MDTKNNGTPPAETEAELEAFTLEYMLWDEWTDTLKGKLREDEERAIKRFAKITGCTERSPLALMFMGFLNGLGYGLKLAADMEKGT